MEKDYIWHYDSPLGGITLGSNGEAITGLWFNGQKYFADTMKGVGEEMRTMPFRKAVWEILLTIPYGKTMTYGEIAKQLALQKGIQQMSAQAVGSAVGHNSISLIIPCHRVVGSDGSLTGYAGGIDKKAKLLKLEGIR